MKRLNYVFCVCMLLTLLVPSVPQGWAATCQVCQKSFPDDYNYCPYCARLLKKDSEPKSFPEDYNYCPYCSKSLADVTVNSIAMKLTLIKPGSFMMGSDSGIPNEKPVHKVTLTEPFYIGVHEVTQEQYEKVMKANPAYFKGPKRPVEAVSWNDAQEFCRRLSKMENRRYRLPTEAEWEYACRAGTSTEYYWGSNFDPRYAWLTHKSGQATHDVGTRLPNAWGLYDMSGNVAPGSAIPGTVDQRIAAGARRTTEAPASDFVLFWNWKIEQSGAELISPAHIPFALVLAV